MEYFSKNHPSIILKKGRLNNKKHKYAFNGEYFDLSKRSKVIVSCNPNDWIGNFRLFEAFSGNTLLFVDYMPTLKYIFINKKHIIYYSRYQEQEEKLLFYLKNNNERVEIANNAYTLALNKQTYNRVANFILQEINKENNIL